MLSKELQLRKANLPCSPQPPQSRVVRAVGLHVSCIPNSSEVANTFFKLSILFHPVFSTRPFFMPIMDARNFTRSSCRHSLRG